MRVSWAFLLIAWISTPAAAATRVVPDAFPTIASALAGASAGDTVLVRSGTYPEHLQLVDGVVLLGEDLLDRPIIDGTHTDTVLTATGGVLGFTVERCVIRNGLGAGLGGGAELSAATVVFRDCLFQQNTANLGGGVGSAGSALTLERCAFENNVATQSGGGVTITDLSSPMIDDCTFLGNSAFAGGAIAVRNGCTPTISGCLMDGSTADQGAAVWFDFLAGGSLTSNTIVHANANGGGGALYFNALSAPTIDHNVIAFGAAGGATFAVTGADPTFGCNCVFGNAGGDSLLGGTDLGTNLSLDPQFCDEGFGDYGLFEDSPCATDVTCGLIGAFPVGCTVVSAGSELEFRSWGAIKSQWR
ncbi:MAG: hypothetical protein DHS20C21_21660 [Gemmatimonadota bacterium]|nr:MAG: hypothetical protein DHS20C21_21660 [Gemmatimonadota bacterium]